MGNETKVADKNRANIVLVVVLCVAVGLLISTTVLWLTNMSRLNNMNLAVENVYERNFYDFVDNVNNAEVKLSKVLASDYDSYSRKLLVEISKNTNSASYNLSNLPISIDGLDETKKFINQVSGYIDSLAEKLNRGQSLDDGEKETLQNIYISMTELNQNLAKFSQEYMSKGYNIFKNGKLMTDGYNGFTKSIQGIKSSDVEYPTMIYDGPFSDGQYNKQIKGLSGNLVDVGEAKQVILYLFKDLKESDVEFTSETDGKFSTFDFIAKLPEKIELYIQVTKSGGKILTISGYGDDETKNTTLSEAISYAKGLIKEQTGIEFDCVWSDIVSNDAYLNFAPVQAGVVLYPDLIKVKVDLSSGKIVGYSATPFYTNHTPRAVQSATFNKKDAEAKIQNGYDIEMTRLCVAPLEYGEEKLCYEFKCNKNGETYYIYINANNGITENILKIIKTNDGSKLM